MPYVESPAYDESLGAGIYTTLDAAFVVERYGQQMFNKGDASAEVALMVYALVVGERTAFPVVEAPERPPDGYLGAPIAGKADTHLVIAKWGRLPGSPTEGSTPCHPDDAEWSTQRSYTEVVSRDGSQLLPLGYVMVKSSVAEEAEDVEEAQDDLNELSAAESASAAFSALNLPQSLLSEQQRDAESIVSWASRLTVPPERQTDRDQAAADIGAGLKEKMPHTSGPSPHEEFGLVYPDDSASQCGECVRTCADASSALR